MCRMAICAEMRNGQHRLKRLHEVRLWHRNRALCNITVCNEETFIWISNVAALIGFWKNDFEFFWKHFPPTGNVAQANVFQSISNRMIPCRCIYTTAALPRCIGLQSTRTTLRDCYGVSGGSWFSTTSNRQQHHYQHIIATYHHRHHPILPKINFIIITEPSPLSPS